MYKPCYFLYKLQFAWRSFSKSWNYTFQAAWAGVISYFWKPHKGKLILEWNFTCHTFSFWVHSKKKLRWFLHEIFFEDYHIKMLHESVEICTCRWLKYIWVLSSEALKCGEEFTSRCLRSFTHVVERYMYMYVSKWLAAGLTANTFVGEWRFLVGEGGGVHKPLCNRNS